MTVENVVGTEASANAWSLLLSPSGPSKVFDGTKHISIIRVISRSVQTWHEPIIMGRVCQQDNVRGRLSIS